MKWFVKSGLYLALAALVGCTSVGSNTSSEWAYPPMAIPLKPTVEQQVQLARLTQLVKRADINDEVRAKVLYERGNYLDSVGLADLARLDFNQSLTLNPAQPYIFNLLGVHFTQISEFDAAYEAFDSALELDPDNAYVLRNRAIALYYGDRLPLAIADIDSNLKQTPTDTFSLLWQYFIVMESDPELAHSQLQSAYANRNKDWSWDIVGMVLGEISEEKALSHIVESTTNNEELAQRLTEAYFYLAKSYHHQKDYSTAIALYKRSLALNVYDYIEHRFSFTELGRIYQAVQENKSQATAKN
ncbi:lipoprotein NlpI [Vibrio sp.]|nr:lipoprotein NlpI [Vibrio sp.]